MEYKYRASVLKELARHGIIPRGNTPPEVVHEFVNDLYRIEIRALKQRMLSREILKVDYSRRVEDLRKRYPILALPIRFWIETV
jgi:hypothetical protein